MVTWESLDALSHQLELCKIGPSTRVAIVLDPQVRADRAALIRAAVTRTGAEAVEVRSIRESTTRDGVSLLQTLAGAADVIVTTTTSPVSADEDCQVLKLLDRAPQSFPPHANLRRRVHRLDDLLFNSDMLHLHDDHGSDLRIALAGSSVASDAGLISDASSHAVFPSGWAQATPAQGTVHGTLVVMPGDANLGAQRIISSPVRLHIINDLISEIEGESPDADAIRALLEYAGEPSAYGIAAITLGLNPGTVPLVPFDERLLDAHLSRLLAGVVTISFGHNLVADRPCPQTVTLALANRSLAIDDLPVLTTGTLEGDFAPDVYELG